MLREGYWEIPARKVAKLLTPMLKSALVKSFPRNSCSSRPARGLPPRLHQTQSILSNSELSSRRTSTNSFTSNEDSCQR